LAAAASQMTTLNGIAVLGILALISKGVANYGFEAIYSKVLQRLKDEEGLTEDELIEKINNYPISRGLKLKLIDKIESQR